MKTNTLSEKENVHEVVRQNYAKVATSQQTGCCGNDRPTATAADQLGYSPEEIAALPEGVL